MYGLYKRLLSPSLQSFLYSPLTVGCFRSVRILFCLPPLFTGNCCYTAYLPVLHYLPMLKTVTVSAARPKFNVMQVQPSRFVIYLSDVMLLHQCSPSTASRKIQSVKDSLGKKQHQLVSIQEYCVFFGLGYVETCSFLKLL